jgi:biotin operon repressor
MLHKDRGDHVHESGIENDHLVPIGEFHFSAIDRACFGVEASDDHVSFSDAAASWAVILDWICQLPKLGPQSGDIDEKRYKMVAARALALHQLLSPGQSRFKSQVDVAKELGITKASISKFMLGLRDQLGTVLAFSGKRGFARQSCRKAQVAAVKAGVHSSFSRKDKKEEPRLDAVGE